jgi:hypothetical protein
MLHQFVPLRNEAHLDKMLLVDYITMNQSKRSTQRLAKPMPLSSNTLLLAIDRKR